MRKHSKEIDQALSDLTEAKRRLAGARRKLGRLTDREGPSHLVEKDWQWAHDLVAARKEKLLSFPGVVGCGLGFRIRADEHLSTPCLTVYVDQKLPKDQLAPGAELPKSVRSGRRRLEIDVMELGSFKRQLRPGDSIGPNPLFDRGTLGAFAQDFQHGDIVGITAMHVSPFRDFPVQGATCIFQSPCPGTDFGALRQGTMTGIDAAKLALVDQPAALLTVLPDIGRVRGWRPTVFPGDRNTPVRMFGATSGFQAGILVNPSISIPSQSLDDAILVDIPTEGGDSGCALVDPENLLLGFLVGRGQLAAFTPAGLVLSRLGCDIPSV